MTWAVDPNGNATVRAYDSRGHATTLTDPQRRVSSWSCDAVDNGTLI